KKGMNNFSTITSGAPGPLFETLNVIYSFFT
ncbi:MAG: hypothetical protein ACI8SC_002202, partial [Colwellia sp.]